MRKLIAIVCYLPFCINTQVQSQDIENVVATVPQPELIEKTEPESGSQNIPYEKWKLPNGLTIIIHEDHSDPIVQIEVRYHVGSARESLGKSGFAHFFEHMMFQGSDNVGDDEHFKIVSSAGGSMNGYTTSDNTVYFETLPSNSLEKGLWLEADRMGFLLDSVTQDKFEVQRKTVKNEKAQNQLNQPYGLLTELSGQLLYPPGHPYSWPVIGYVDDLDRADVNDLKNFFLRWYGPNNAILTVGGDVNPKEVVDLAMKYFGPIPKGPEVVKQRFPAPVVADDKYSNSKDDVYLPLTQMIFPTVPLYHRDEAPLDLLAMIMGDGKNSIFYKNFEKTEIAADAGVFNGTRELSGEFTIYVVAYPMLEDGTELTFADIEKKIRETLVEFEESGITDAELDRAKKKMYASYQNQLGSVYSKVDMLSSWHMYGRPAGYNFQNEVDRYQRVTKADLLRVFNRYIKGRSAAFTNIWPLPLSEDRKKFKKESFNPNANIELKEEEQYKGLVYNKSKDVFDRSVNPKSGEPKPAVIPDYYSSKLENGIEIIGTEFSEVPKVVIMVDIEGGQLMESEKGVKAGTAWMTAALMNEGTQNYTTEEISAQLEDLGSSISFSSGVSSTNIYVECLKENLDATLKILEEKLFNPGFRDDDFKRVKKQALASIKDQKTNGAVTASKVFNRLMYGNTVLGKYYTGTYNEVYKLKADDLRSYYEKFYSPSVAKITVIGDVKEEAVLSKLSIFNSWKAKSVTMPELDGFPTYDKTQIYLVHQSDFKTTASQVRIGYLAHKYDYNGVMFKSNVMNFSLGGAFNSRINMNLREEKGFTYGARSGFAGSHYPGAFIASATVKAKVTDSTIVEFMKEIEGFRTNGITDEEMAFTKNNLLQKDVLNYETLFSKAGYLSNILEYELPKDYKDQQAKIVQDITKEEINALAKEHLKVDNMVILVVGNKYLIKDKLEALGYGKVIELDKDEK